MQSQMLARCVLPFTAVLSAWWLFRQANKPKRIIQDEVVVVVGASSGVGLAVAKLYASLRQAFGKKTIHIVARSAGLAEVAREISSKSGCQSVHAHTANACSEEDLAELSQKILRISGKIDTLVFCAGALTTSGFLDLNAARPGSASDAKHGPHASTVSGVAKASYDANVLSCMLTVAALVPLLQHATTPRIAVLSSVAAEIPAPTRSIYAAHKAALSMFLRCLRIELDSVPVGKLSPNAGKGIGISIIHPASINTGLRSRALDSSSSAGATQEHESSAMTPEYVAEQVKKAIDLEVDEVWLPGLYWWVAKVGMVMAPEFIAKKAKRKYNWQV
ncbi:NAD(P)-binding protein [Cystobasidium minutum MCA 4210]|uniref:NAD(P)-binding protein n=1 Tax=Cystobasidium minutum MCA 4210 TaxID=1397322 RepID=UPI0034CFFF12|eukprot:jgi/Rhomi1/170315/fgenesh1_kg.4_\